MINRTQKLSRALISHYVMDYPLLYIESFGGKNRRSIFVRMGAAAEGQYRECFKSDGRKLETRANSQYLFSLGF